MPTPTLTSARIRKKSALLELSYADGQQFNLSFEFLRVHSPSAEVQGHGKQQKVLQYGKSDVLIEKIDQVGNYGLQIYYDDMHHSGIYTWDYLYQLACNQETLYNTYLDELEQAGKSRISGAIQVIDLRDLH